MATTPSDDLFRNAVRQLLVEIFSGPPTQEAYILNPGDSGLLGTLEAVDADTASAHPTAGRTTIAAHVDHVLYGLSLMNRWAAGEANPWADADWNVSWTRQTVDETQWRDLRDRLRQASAEWQAHFAARTGWDPISAAGAISSVAHTAYHLGAIRQLIAAAK